MTHAHREQLSLQVERATRRLRERLAGLTDDEYLWEPVAHCWTVRRRDTAISPQPEGRGAWVFDNAAEEPSPAPFTTIAWRLMHLVDVIGGYQRVLAGTAVTDDWLEVAPTATAGVALWEEQASAFAQALAQEDDESLQRPVRVPWWPQDTPRWRVLSNVAMEMIHHGAEIALVRDLYLRRDELRR